MAKHQRLKPRAAAITNGATSYFSGKPCKNGHVSERNIRGHCIECVKTANAREKAKLSVMKSRRTAKGFVYVISATNGYVKIGKAGNPYGRFGDHQCSSPLLLTLSYVCECSNPVDIEAAAHAALAAHRSHREWFDVSTDVAVEAVRAALKAAGAQTAPAPRRASRWGAPAMLHAAINEMSIAPVA